MAGGSINGVAAAGWDGHLAGVGAGDESPSVIVTQHRFIDAAAAYLALDTWRQWPSATEPYSVTPPGGAAIAACRIYAVEADSLEERADGAWLSVRWLLLRPPGAPEEVP